MMCETNTETPMKTQDVIDYFGSVAKAADALVEAATKGRIKKNKPKKVKGN
jgi:hypothetical protein